jgi:hypothetical protein
MARQLSEQLEREVNAEELLKAQTKPRPAASPASAVAPSTEFPTPLAPTGVQQPQPDAVANAIADAHRISADVASQAASQAASDAASQAQSDAASQAQSDAASQAQSDAASEAASSMTHARQAADPTSAAALPTGPHAAVPLPLHEPTPEAAKPGHE